MHFGISMFPTDYAIRPDELARALEERDFESLWVPEPIHIPESRRSPWPGRKAAAKPGRDFVFMVPSETRDKLLPLVDAYAAVTR